MTPNGNHYSSTSIQSGPTKAATGRTILLVEDEASIRNLLTRYLTAHGYEVLSAVDAATAEPLWRTNHARIDLLLSDVFLPGSRSGSDLATAFSQEKSALKIILTSGCDADSFECAHGASVNFLLKPYHPSELLGLIQGVLGQNGNN